MKHMIDKIVRQYAKSRESRLDRLRDQAVELQKELLKSILYRSAKCTYVDQFKVKAQSSYKSFASNIPVVKYEDIEHHIKDMMLGKRNILTPGVVKCFSKSSGTTNAKSKFIPVTKHFMSTCYTRTNWDVVTLLYQHNPEIGVFRGKNLLMGGSLKPYHAHTKTMIGDVSAIMIENMPHFAKSFYTPNTDIALMSDWDVKLELMTTICSEANVVGFAGVPTWSLVLFRRILEYKRANHMQEVWPNAKVYLHGGVGFDPYRNEFKKLFPSDDFCFMEAYNASEGYFGLQDRIYEEGMLLLPDNGVFFEFIPMEELNKENPKLLTLEQIEVDQDYALVITTASGLWRYNIGDLVRFSSKNPYRFKVSGRTKQFINTFGEELMVHNTDEAIAATCNLFNCRVEDYTVAPIYFDDLENKPGHQWLIEFEKHPNDIGAFEEHLDKFLQEVNSDYEAKRFKNLALSSLQIKVLPKGSFKSWLKSNKRWGAQVKVPRLSNDRKIIEEIIKHSNL